MPTIDACHVIASLHPGMPVRDAVRRLASAGLTGSVEDSWTVRVGPDRQTIDIIDLRASFAREAVIHGVHIGMSSIALRDHPLGRRLIPAVKNGTEITGSYLADQDAGWEMIIEATVQRGVYHVIYQLFGLFQSRAPAEYAAMQALVAKQVRDKADATANAARRTAERERLRAVSAHLRDLTDPDELLDYWARHDRVWGEGGPDLARYAEWLRAGDPSRWHAVALSWNWDNGVVPLRWIASRRDCDAATALTIFHAGEPIDQPADTDEGRLLAAIRDRWAGAGYDPAGIGFDAPRHVVRLGPDEAIAAIPLAMRRPLQGRTEGFEPLNEGFPIILF